MAEIIQLTQPEPVIRPGATSYRPVRLTLDLGVIIFPDDSAQIDPARAYIEALMLGDNGKRFHHMIATGPEAVTLIGQLNTANLSTTSLHRRIMQILIQQGVFEGTIVNE